MHLLLVTNAQLKKIKLKQDIGAADYLAMQNYLDLNPTSVVSGKPYIDLEVTDDYIIREFGQNIDPIELMWHRDDEHRTVEVVESGKGWQFQYDEKLPLTLTPNTTISILKHEWHRLWKGEGKLILKINKL